MKDHLLGLLAGLLIGVVGVLLFVHFNVVPAQPVLGAGAHSYSAKQLGSLSVVSNAVTTTCYTNNGSTSVVMDKLIAYVSSTASSILTTTSINMAVSTDTVNVATALSSGVGASSMGTTLTSTPNYFTSSTFSTVSQRILPVGSSVIMFRANSFDTTTQAFCGVEYYQP